MIRFPDSTGYGSETGKKGQHLTVPCRPAWFSASRYCSHVLCMDVAQQNRTQEPAACRHSSFFFRWVWMVLTAISNPNWLKSSDPTQPIPSAHAVLLDLSPTKLGSPSGSCKDFRRPGFLLRWGMGWEPPGRAVEVGHAGWSAEMTYQDMTSDFLWIDHAY